MTNQVPNSSKSNLRGSVPIESAGPRPPVLDADCYMPMLDEINASEEDKRELLAVMWDIVCHFVNMGYGVDSLSLLFPDLLGNSCEAREDIVSSNNTPDTNKNTLTATTRAEKTDS